MERAIIKADNGEYFFFDDPIWGEDLQKSEVAGIVNIENEIGYHACNHSALYEDLTGYVDQVQNENDLPDDGKFIVTYFVADENLDLLSKVDFGITKAEIIENVKAQKYIEGADYFTIDQFQKVS